MDFAMMLKRLDTYCGHLTCKTPHTRSRMCHAVSQFFLLLLQTYRHAIFPSPCMSPTHKVLTHCSFLAASHIGCCLPVVANKVVPSKAMQACMFIFVFSVISTMLFTLCSTYDAITCLYAECHNVYACVGTSLRVRHS